jgi:hypothetical protein
MPRGGYLGALPFFYRKEAKIFLKSKKDTLMGSFGQVKKNCGFYDDNPGKDVYYGLARWIIL